MLCVAHANYLPVPLTQEWHIKCFESEERCSMNKIHQNSIRTACYTTLFAVLALFSAFRGTGLAVPQDQAGQTLFKSNCATCHSQNGTPTAVGKSLNAPDLRSALVQNQTKAQLQQIISNGKGNMPAFKGKLSTAEVDSLTAFVLTLSKRHK
jgi:cytochrome c6